MTSYKDNAKPDSDVQGEGNAKFIVYSIRWGVVDSRMDSEPSTQTFVFKLYCQSKNSPCIVKEN